MPTFSLKTGDPIFVDTYCTEKPLHTRLELDQDGQVWLICPCCSGQGSHPYQNDGDEYVCMTCLREGNYVLEDDDRPSGGWPRQN